MMHSYIIAFLMTVVVSIVMLPASSDAQQVAPEIQYYLTTEDYTSGKAGKEAVIPTITLEKPGLLRITKWIDKETGKKSKTVRIPWAVRYNNELYISLRFCIEYGHPEVMITPDIIGRYCVLIIKKDSPREVKNGNIGYVGVPGVLTYEMAKWGHNWRGEDGKKYKILIVDTHDIDLWFVDEVRAASWKMLDRKNYNQILNESLTDEEVKSLSLEQVIQIISVKNSEEE